MNINTLHNNYSVFEERKIENLYIEHKLVVELINDLKKNENFQISEIGKSVEGREIYSIKFGRGEKTIMLWTQMHGNEPTATAAVFDILNFIAKENPKKWFDELSLVFIPMLNPDGATKFTRHNALGIDINRDALQLQAPESKILRQQQELFRPQFGFNLHDQNPYYAAGNKEYPSCISFLAPAFNEARQINATRKTAIDIIAAMQLFLDQYIENKIARYSDKYNSKCFGDYFQQNGVSTILIEAGFLDNDPNKHEIRKYVALAIMHAFESIADYNFSDNSVDIYNQIPENEEIYFDILLKNVRITKNNISAKVDIGINKKSEIVDKKIRHKAYVEAIGDLTGNFGHLTIDINNSQLFDNQPMPNDEFDINVLKDFNF